MVQLSIALFTLREKSNFTVTEAGQPRSKFRYFPSVALARL